MAELRLDFRSSVPVVRGIGITAVSLVAALLAGAGMGGASLALALLLGASVVLMPSVGIALALLFRQVADTFWTDSVLSIGGFDFDPRSILGIVIPAAIATVLLGRRWRSTNRTLWITVLLYSVVSAWGVLIAPSKGLAITYLARVVFPFAFLAVGELISNEPRAVLLVCTSIASYGLVALGSGALQLAGVLEPIEGAVSQTQSVTRITGLYHHPLDICLRAAVGVPFALMLAEVLRVRGLRIGAYVLAVAYGALAAATLVRSSLVAFVTEGAVWLWTRGARLAVLLFLPAAVVAAVTLPGIRTVIQDAVRPIEEGRVYEIGSGRALIFAAQVAAFADGTPLQKLFGRGLGSSPQMTIAYNPVPALDLGGAGFEEGQIVAHNQILRVLVESGLVGVVLLGFLVWHSTQTAVHLMTRSSDRLDRALGRATVLLLAAMIVFSLASVPFDAPSVTWPC